MTQENKPHETKHPPSFHGLNNHLAACKGYTELLARVEGLSPEARELAERLYKGFEDAIACSMALENHYKGSAPPASTQPPKEKSKVLDEATMGCESLLLIEDDEAFREMLSSYLQRRGYNVFLAGHGEEGLQILQENIDEIDLILLDRHMPRCDGLEFLPRMRQYAPRLRVLMLSGNDLDHEHEFLERHGVVARLKKPFPLKELSKVLREVLEAPAPIAREQA